MSVLVPPEFKVARAVRRPPDSNARKSDYLRRDSPLPGFASLASPAATNPAAISGLRHA